MIFITNLRRGFFGFSFAFFLILSVSAQESAKNKSPFPVKYTSLADQQILIKTVTLAPVYDNLNGIYAKPVQKLLIDLLQSDKSWGYAEIVGHDQNKFIENYDLYPADVLEVLTKTKAQGLLTAFITKGPRGLNTKLKLFTQDQGLLLAEESVEDLNTFEISKLRVQFTQMYQNLKNKLPYRGYVLSRRGLEVTISLGTINGVKAGQELTLAQIIKLNRHPKLKFLVGVEKEIIAKVIVKKAEPYLSFGQITFEKETGVVDVGAKVLPTEFISYPLPMLNKEGEVIGERPGSGKNNVVAETATEKETTSEEPETTARREELFDRHNTSGILTAQLAITQYSETNSLVNGSEAHSSQSFAPGLHFGALYYLKNNFFADLTYQLSTFSASNGLSGSSPANLSFNLTKYSLSAGYDYIYEDEDGTEDSVKFTGIIGLTNYKTSVSDSSPVSLTSTETSAVNLTFQASMPITQTLPLTIGGHFDLFFNPNYSESPVNSGSASTSMTSFGFFGTYKLSDNYNARADFTLTDINNRFSGSASRANPAGSAKQEYMTERFGIEYLF
jgi:hypothetical protein